MAELAGCSMLSEHIRMYGTIKPNDPSVNVNICVPHEIMIFIINFIFIALLKTFVYKVL